MSCGRLRSSFTKDVREVLTRRTSHRNLVSVVDRRSQGKPAFTPPRTVVDCDRPDYAAVVEEIAAAQRDARQRERKLSKRVLARLVARVRPAA